MDNEDKPVAELFADFMRTRGLTVAYVFVPFSRSRKFGMGNDGNPSLNWKVTVSKNGHAVLTTDYTAGMAHAPSYKQTFGRKTIEDVQREEVVAWECEHGVEGYIWPTSGRISAKHGNNAKPITPKDQDVFYSLLMDSDVLNYSTFEEWAPNLGYDPDSREAEKIYRACLEIALALRNMVGEDGFSQLQEIFEGY